MDFEFTDEQRRFRDEVRFFLEREVPLEDQEVFGVETEEQHRRAHALALKLASRRWLAIGWPEEHGGGGKGPMEQGIVNEEMGYRMAPRRGSIGLGLVGPSLMVFGTPEQKEQYLGPIARGEAEYCQGFSEPNVGSDLASLQLRAVRDGDEWVLNGSKMFTSHAFQANYMYLLARTDPQASKHRGISVFIADLDTPGISRRPFPYINGAVAAQTFFDNARLPATALLGEENRGWYHAMTSLDYERSGLERYGRTRRAFDDFVEFCRETRLNGRLLAANPVVKHKLAELRLGMDIWGLLCWKIAWMQSSGAIPNADASVAFLHGSEERLRFAQAAMQILGPYATLRHESKWAPMRGTIEGIHRESMHLHGAGTNEVHRNIIAGRGLGMPR
ncbi:MAG: acyl-CoA dehydrogenase family protein [Dehalococcoidia bacterium]|nr:acyl-CoA dehydrogenase family protein [Dehalococcoidia bacterium]